MSASAPVCSVLIIALVKSWRICTVDRFEPNAWAWERSVLSAAVRSAQLRELMHHDADGYEDFGTYGVLQIEYGDDLTQSLVFEGSYTFADFHLAGLGENTWEISFAETAGVVFSFLAANGTTFSYTGDNPTGGTIGAIAIYDLSFNRLAGFSGINASIDALVTQVQAYASSQNSAGLDAIFYNNATIRYSGIGEKQTIVEDNQFGSDTFVASQNNDYFNGLTSPFDGGSSGGGDTVDYSHTPGPNGVTVDLTIAGQQNTIGSGMDSLFNIENLRGSNQNDTLTGNHLNNILEGGLGNDALAGGDGLDRALYAGATGPISVNMAAGTVSGNGVGNDTISSIESIRGTSFNDIYVSTGWAGASVIGSVPATFNEFEGMEGDDQITGNNGSTKLSYLHATSGVVVDIAAGIADGDSSVGHDTFTGVSFIRGSSFGDALRGSNNGPGVVEVFEGGRGNDLIDGRGGFDRVIYGARLDDDVFGGITIDLADGTVTGDYTVGIDTLRSIEAIRGSQFDDVYDATGFTAFSANAGSAGVNNTGAAFNEFEGQGGNDVITGNGNTRLAYVNATGGVTVDLVAGTAIGDGSVGNDTFTGVSQVQGSAFVDTLRGSNNAANTSENFEGRAGNDTIDGRGGFDQADYGNDNTVTNGIFVQLAAGTVLGDLSIGNDALFAVEAVRGTSFLDHYDATDFGISGSNVGSSGTFNQFEGLGGDDEIIGNNNTRVAYNSATGAVVVDLQAGTADGNLSVGHDTLTNVSQARGSNFGDTLSGNGNNNTLDWQGGADELHGRGGNDTLTGGAAGDTFVFTANGGNDTITDFQDGQDLFRLDGIFASSSDQAFLDFVTNLQASANGDHTIDGLPGVTITLTGVEVKTLGANDFVIHA